MKIKWYILTVTLIFGITLKGQIPDYKIEHPSSEIWLTNHPINDIIQDKEGFLWMATWSGLAKYDSYSVKMYRQTMGDTKALKGNYITCLFEDSKGQIWVGTLYTGFYKYDRAQDGFVQYTNDPKNMNSLSNNSVWAITEDKSGHLWVGTKNGLNRFDPEEEKFIHYKNIPDDNRSFSHNFVYSLANTEDGLWVGCEVGLNRLVYKADGTPDYFVRYQLAPEDVNEDDYLRHNFIRVLHVSEKEPNTIWVGTSIGLKKITYSDTQLSNIQQKNYLSNTQDTNSLSHAFVADIWENNERLWIATFDGLNVLDKQTETFQYFFAQDTPNSLSSNIVKTLFKDRSEVLWVGTEKGVNKINLNAKPFKSIHLNEKNNITSCVINAKNREGLWIGTVSGGLFFLPIKDNQADEKNIQSYEIKTQLATNMTGFISDLSIDKNDNLWIATQGAGLLKINELDIPKKGATLQNIEQFTKENKLKDDYIMSLLQTKSGEIWIGYWDKGIGRYDVATNNFQHFSYTENFSSNLEEYPIVHMAEVEENGELYIWIGTQGRGMSKLKFDEEDKSLHLIKHYQYKYDSPGNLSNNDINCFYQNEPNKLWIGTGNGLNSLDLITDKFEYFLEKDGLASNVIQSILGDKNSDIWVSTQKGISHIVGGQKETMIKNFDAYDVRDNFFYDESACALASGQLVFGGAFGLNMFQPEAIQIDTTPPQIAITDIRLFNKSVPIGETETGRMILDKHIGTTDELQLTYRDNVISIAYCGLHFTKPQNTKYAHKLEGFDEDWVHTDASQRIAYYTNLPHDDFQFKVKAANSDGVWSKPVGFKLSISPPFWLTNWAFLLYILLCFALLYGLVRVARMRAEFAHSLQLERIEQEKLKEIDQMKTRFFMNVSHELRTPLTLIISPLEQYIRERNVNSILHKSFTRMYYNANRLLTMINQLLDIRKSEAGLMKLSVAHIDIVEFVSEITLAFKPLAEQCNIQFKFNSEKDHILVWIDREQLEKVIYNLLSNAFKFTENNNKIGVKIYEKDEFIFIAVKDTGKGISPEHQTLIFDRFFQAETEHETSKSIGTGIGLALSKNIVEKHHGKIGVESQIGHGSTFYIALKKGNEHFESEEIVTKPMSQYSSNDIYIPEPTQENSSINNLTENSERLHILLVEDSENIRSYLRENLEANYQVSEAADGVEALQKALANPPDLIIADISMPRMDGIEFCEKIKSDLNTSHIPVVLLTAHTSLIFRLNGLETGADDYIIKPFNMQLLKARVRNLIESRQQLKTHFTTGFDFDTDGIVLHSLDHQLLIDVKNIVEKNIINADFSVEDLASNLHISRMQLYRKLKALTGESPSKIIRNMRLKYAAKLLESKQYNVANVTYMVGYNDLKAFREQFKKEFGVSPGKYAEMN